MLKKNYFYYTYSRILDVLQERGKSILLKLFTLSFISSVLEFAGLVIILPIINILIDNTLVERNKYFSFLYSRFEFTSIPLFVLTLMGIVVLLFLLRNFLIIYLLNKQARISFALGKELAVKRFSTYIEETYEFHAKNNSGELVRNSTLIPFQFVNAVLMPFILIVNEGLIAFLIVAALLIYDFALFFSLLACFLPVFLIYLKYSQRNLSEIKEFLNIASRNMNIKAFQAFNNFQEILLFKKQKYFEKDFAENASKNSDAYKRLYILNNVGPKVVELLAILVIFTILLSGFFLDKDSKELGQFLAAFAIAVTRLVPSANRIFTQFNIIKSSDFALDYLKNLKTKSTSAISNNGQKFFFKDKIELKNITFSYSKDLQPVFQDFNLVIPKGTTIGVTGPSGSGKSTLIKLLLRFYKEQKGGIYVDGVKLNEKNTEAWYDMVSLVPQQVNIIDGNFIENIAFGEAEEDVDMNLLNEVVKKSQLQQLVEASSEDLYTQLGEHGIRISGGQKQRIAIARALYKKAQILIFDEATSSLDTETEAMITESIRELSKENLTIIIIAHREQSLKYCDRVYEINF